jgi:DNA-binding NarL/FixJ family response regulator
MSQSSVATHRMISSLPVRVFIVEDSPLFRERLAEEITERKNLELIGTADKETEAINAVAGSPPDLLFVDINLLEGNGLNVLREVRKTLPKSKLSIVIMTNHASPAFRRKSLKLGADYFIDKSIEFERIPGILNAIASARKGHLSH